MDLAKKKEIMDDLDAFRNNRDFYRRTGKPWKRGYLLYGPPGTGKSTMIAAMANHLNYDIYDVELTVVHSNNDLRKLVIETTSKSVIVIEDIDCSLDLTGDRARKAAQNPYDPSASMVTLSGLLNFIDGLWSACGGERIVVFTTNHVDKLDPALIRRGRMDMHIEMSYCGFEAFRTLAVNYLGVHNHKLFGAVEELLREVDITPADVAECLMTAACGEDSALELLIQEIKKKGEEAAAKAAAEAKAAEEANVVTKTETDDAEAEEELAESAVMPADVAKYLMSANVFSHASLNHLLGNLIMNMQTDAKAPAEAAALMKPAVDETANSSKTDSDNKVEEEEDAPESEDSGELTE